ncbi:hypothetical protein TEA_018902 [Camellia sinensis var. sinensis]|uniref:Uncharacterized protein n=1 Tax=Camellia sinensis var. sinensis TaxID=542762 RepID=A0A4S4EDE2_CAMSN|nr:hypothetical protein TEA_018902 [Camellia sinensis var. sinensis]
MAEEMEVKVQEEGERVSMKPWEQHSAVISIPRFDYNAPSSLLYHSQSGFLVTCPIKREKSATKEAMSILEKCIGIFNCSIYVSSESSDANVAAKRRKLCVLELDSECPSSIESKSAASNFGDSSGKLLEDSCLTSAKSDTNEERSPTLSLVKLTGSGLLLFTIPRNDSLDVVDTVSKIICFLESGSLNSPLMVTSLFHHLPQPLLLLSGVGTNAIGYDLSPESSFARYMCGQGFDTWVLGVRGAGLSMQGSDSKEIEKSAHTISDMMEATAVTATDGVFPAEQQSTNISSAKADSDISVVKGDPTGMATVWDESRLVTELTETFMRLSERLSGFLSEGQSKIMYAKLFDQISRLLEDFFLYERFNEIRGKLPSLLEARQTSAVASQIRDLSQKLVNIIEESQRSVSPQLFNLQEQFFTTIEDFQKQLDLMVQYDWDFDHYLEEDIPAALEYIRATKPKDESYFNLKKDPYKNKVKTDFVKDRRRVKREYDEFKVRSNGLPDSIRRRSEAYHAREEIKALKQQRQKTDDEPVESVKILKATWMADGTHWPGTWLNPTPESEIGAGARSTNTARGTCFSAPVSLKKVLKEHVSKLQTKDAECDVIQKRLNDLEQNTVSSLRKALKDVAMEKDAAVVARWCHRIFPIQATCCLNEKELRAIVSKLVIQFVNDKRNKLARPIKFAVGYNRRGIEEAELKISRNTSKDSEEIALLDRNKCFSVVATAVKDVVPDSVVDLKSPELSVLVELLPISGLPNGSLVVAISVLPLNLITTKPRLCIKSLLSNTKARNGISSNGLGLDLWFWLPWRSLKPCLSGDDTHCSLTDYDLLRFNVDYT